MLIIPEIERFSSDSFDPIILSLGNFDGVHRGHQALLECGIAKARRQRSKLAVLTFRQHPQGVLHPDAKPLLLTSTIHKLVLLERQGVDLCFLLSFTEKFSKQGPMTFIEEVLVKSLHIKGICLGHNARFGRERQGDVKLMREASEKLGFSFEEVRAVKASGDFVSSSRIRKLISEGKLEEASSCLGRPFSVISEVVKGAGRGQKLGFPTANLNISGVVLPPTGVYPVQVRLLEVSEKAANHSGGEEFHAPLVSNWIPGLLNYGYRPTFDPSSHQAVAEAFLFDFDGDLYGKWIEIVFHARLRSEISFEDPEALKQQIEQDISAARRFFSTPGPSLKI